MKKLRNSGLAACAVIALAATALAVRVGEPAPGFQSLLR